MEFFPGLDVAIFQNKSATSSCWTPWGSMESTPPGLSRSPTRYSPPCTWPPYLRSHQESSSND